MRMTRSGVTASFVAPGKRMQSWGAKSIVCAPQTGGGVKNEQKLELAFFLTERKISTPDIMEKEIKQQAGGDVLSVIAWAHANRKQLTWTLGLVAAVGLVAGLYYMHQLSRQDAADAAFCAVNLPFVGQRTPTAADAEQFAQVADSYPGTSAGANARLLAGGIDYDTGQYAAAQGMFERFLAEHGDSPLANEAAVGAASSLEVQGKLADAAVRYEAILQRGQDSMAPQVKSALARIYTEQNQPDRALQEYKEMLQANGSDSWTMEARVQAGELLEKYPSLRQKVAAPAAPAAPAAGPVLDLGKP
jgi:tetratricopeptide (TPR) repeat protein